MAAVHYITYKHAALKQSVMSPQSVVV